MRICKEAGFKSYSECTDLLTGIQDKVTNVTWAKGTDRLELQHIKFRNTCYHLHHKCVFGVSGVMTGALLLHQSSLGTH